MSFWPSRDAGMGHSARRFPMEALIRVPLSRTLPGDREPRGGAG
jgi:hypothetical protein